MGIFLVMKRTRKKTSILIFSCFILIIHFASCYLNPKEATLPDIKRGPTKWLKLSFPDRTRTVITEKDHMLIEKKVNGSEVTKIKEGIQAILSSGEVFVDLSLSDLDGDSKEEVLAIIGRPGDKYGDRFLVFSLEEGRVAKITKDIYLNKLRPWRIKAGDIDGDGKNEVLLGVYKKTRFDRKKDNRLFVYGWDKNDLFPKWLGSSLSLPFYDFAVGDIEGKGKEMLVSLERLKDGGSRVMIYEWSGFGFLGEWEIRSLRQFRNLMLLDSDDDGKEEIFIEL